jgi:hypothetical protein
MSVLDALPEKSTGASISGGAADAVVSGQRFAPVRLLVFGGSTGTTAAAAPGEVLDSTSADVLDFVRRIAPSTVDVMGGGSTAVDQAQTAVQRQLAEIKRKSDLTWGQLAEAMDVDARAVYLWRGGGGISAAHEERLHELSALVDSLDAGVPADVKAELVEARANGSLLERLRQGESPRELQGAAPWRARAIEAVDRNMGEWRNGGVLDEDFVFLLYLHPEGVDAFAAEARELLDASAPRRAWEALLDERAGGSAQPEIVEVGALPDEEMDEDDAGISPLFPPDELGIILGVGAIASRRPLHEGR